MPSSTSRTAARSRAAVRACTWAPATCCKTETTLPGRYGKSASPSSPARSLRITPPTASNTSSATALRAGRASLRPVALSTNTPGAPSKLASSPATCKESFAYDLLPVRAPGARHGALAHHPARGRADGRRCLRHQGFRHRAYGGGQGRPQHVDADDGRHDAATRAKLLCKPLLAVGHVP